MIELKKVSLNFGKKTILDKVDLFIRQGETKVILGPSGTGKSTILKIILGLIRPDSGEVYFDGKFLFDPSDKVLSILRSKLSMVFQNGGLFDSLNVAQNISYRCRRCYDLTPEEIKNRIKKELCYVGLADAERLMPAQLSGGMRKRVGIARALCSQSEIILFDEPTVGLDPGNTYNIQQILTKLKKDRRVTMVIVTHDIHSALDIADEVVILKEGKFIFQGTSNVLKASRDQRVQEFLNPTGNPWDECEVN